MKTPPLIEFKQHGSSGNAEEYWDVVSENHFLESAAECSWHQPRRQHSARNVFGQEDTGDFNQGEFDYSVNNADGDLACWR